MSAPRGGASAAFVDPRLTAAQAHPVWLPQTATDPLCLTAHPIHQQSGSPAGVFIPALPNVEHVLIDTLGRQHVILRAGAVYLQLTIDGSGAVVAPVALSVLVAQRHAIGAAAERLGKLDGLVSASPDVPIASARWTAETKRFRDALIAHDGHRAGATLRETATVIYGRLRIERDWPGKGLRHRLRRDLQRGIALCNGGYRQLLR